METALKHIVYFAIPGDINKLTGGYAYDRRLLAELIQLGVDIGGI